MARSLYKLYLYVVFIALLLIVTGSVSTLLGVLLRATPLRGQNGLAPTTTDVVQSVTLASLALLVAGGLAALHYWLIRRDQRDDHNAANSGVRAFFLNAAEGLATLTAVLTASFTLVFLQPSQGIYTDLSTPLATAISAALLALGLELERRRLPATTGAGGVFQRLHIYGVQLILLFAVDGFLQNALGTTEHNILQSTLYNPCGLFSSGAFLCGNTDLPGPWLAALIPIFAFGVYALLSWRDKRSVIRQVFHVLGLSYGIIVFLIGAERAIEFALSGPFGLPTDAVTFVQSFDFPPIMIFAALAILAYALLLRDDTRAALDGQQTLGVIVQAVVTVLLSVPFWYGLYELARLLIESIAQGSLLPTNSGWPNAIALLVLGVSYIPVALNLSRRSVTTGIHGPRRGFVLALLASGALVVAGSVITLLYALGTALLGAPFDGWQSVARLALSSLLVGLAQTGVYAWIAIREGVFVRNASHAAPLPSAAPAYSPASAYPSAPWPTSPEAAPMQPPMLPQPLPADAPPSIASANGATLATPGAVESILDELLTSRLTREQAAARIRTLAGSGPA